MHVEKETISIAFEELLRKMANTTDNAMGYNRKYDTEKQVSAKVQQGIHWEDEWQRAKMKRQEA